MSGEDIQRDNDNSRLQADVPQTNQGTVSYHHFLQSQGSAPSPSSKQSSQSTDEATMGWQD